MNRKLTKLAELRARRAAQLEDSAVEESYEITDPEDVADALEGAAGTATDGVADAPDESLEDAADPEQVIVSETEDTTVIEVEVKPKRRTRASK